MEPLLFPSPFEKQRHLTVKQYLLIVAFSAVLFSTIGFIVRPDGFIGYDWYYRISQGVRDPYHPPWRDYAQYLTWPGLIGLTCAGLVVGLYQRYASPLIMAASFLSLPLLWMLFLGNLDGIVLLGLTGLPWLTPLATLKPQVSAFAFLSNKRWLAIFMFWIALTILIWGLWPLAMLNHDAHWQSLYPEAEQPQNIELFPWSIPIVLILLWYSRGDMDMLMLAGTFVTPHIIPYSYIVVLPAIARINQWLALCLVVISWLPFSANWVGDWGWYLGHLFPAILWATLYLKRRRLSAFQKLEISSPHIATPARL
jgi:hypothetical protein